MYRPHYPKELFDKLVNDTRLPKSAELLEIGPGTGQATKPLAERGFHITAVELGRELAAKAREVLTGHPNAQIISGDFENADLPRKHYNLVYSATAFHWIKPEVRFTKAHALLKPGGYLAIIHTEHVSDEKGDAFFHAAQPVYKCYVPGSGDSSFRLPRSNDLKPPLIDTALFTLESFTGFPLVISYDAEGYTGLLSTYSPIIVLPDEQRKKFLKGIGRLINEHFGGTIERHFTMTLTIARKC